MKFVSVRLIAQNMQNVVQFYERLTCCKADWLSPLFAEIVTPAAVIAIGSSETVALFRAGRCRPCAERGAGEETLRPTAEGAGGRTA